MNRLVSIVSVNYNQKEHTIEFLDSISESTYDNFEVILVDNGSKDPLDKDLEKNYANLKCIILKENLGFAGGNNVGIKEAIGEYLIFLNNDTLVPPQFISTMVDFMESNDEVGMASPKLIFPNERIQYAGSSDFNKLTGRGSRIGFNEVDQGQYAKNYPTSYAHGAAMITRREVLNKVGLMREDYFLYYEELDWCERIKRNGYSIYYVGATYVIHKESISVGINSPLKVYYMSRNRILFLIRNTEGINRFTSIIFLLHHWCFKIVNTLSRQWKYQTILKSLERNILASK